MHNAYMPPPSRQPIPRCCRALLLIAHGSREATANADTHWAADALRQVHGFDVVQPAFLELAEPDIDAGAARCIQLGASLVALVPYFLSAGTHVRRDLNAAQLRLSRRFPDAQFVLAEPLGQHQLLIEVLADRAHAALRSGEPTMHVLYLHWHAEELATRVAPLRQAGYSIAEHSSTAAAPSLQDHLPDVAVLSLARLPSHGRAVAEWLWEAKKRQHIPIVFVDGAPEKVAVTKKKFPTAHYCTADKLLATLAKLGR